MLFVADRCWDVGGLGTLVLGIWLALNLDEYDFFDGWILGAIVALVRRHRAGPDGPARDGDRRDERGDSRDERRRHAALAAHAGGHRPAGPDGLEAGRMSVLGDSPAGRLEPPAVPAHRRRDALVGALVLVLFALAGRDMRLGFRALLLGVLPGWIVMRVGAQWIASKEGSTTRSRGPGWVDIGFIVSEPMLLLHHRRDGLRWDRGAPAAARRRAARYGARARGHHARRPAWWPSGRCPQSPRSLSRNGRGDRRTRGSGGRAPSRARRRGRSGSPISTPARCTGRSGS